MKKKLILLITLVSVAISFTKCGQIKTGGSDTGSLLDKAIKNIQTAESLNDLKQKNEVLKIAESQLKQAETVEQQSKVSGNTASGLAYYYFATGNFAEAKKYADKVKNKKDPFITVINTRIKLKEKGEEYARESIGILNSVINRSPRMAMAYLALGDSHFLLGNFQEAQKYYTKVLFLGKAFQVRAADRLEVLGEIRSTGIDTKKVQNILFTNAIRRDELADTLDRIFNIDKYLKFGKPGGIAFNDISGSLYSDSIIKLRNKGFFSYLKGNKFEPFKPVTRSEMAMTVEDFLVLQKGNKSIRTRYSNDAKSAIKGINTDDPYYNAIRTALSAKVMNISLDGTINPLEPVSGLETLHIFGNLIKTKKRKR